MKILFAALIVITCACNKPAQEVVSTSNSNIQVDLLFIHDNIKVYRFNDGGNYVYFTDSRIDYKTTVMVGKTPVTINHQTFNVK